MTTEPKIIMWNSAEAAQPATLTLADGTTRQLWVGGGHAYIEESSARYAGCTHRPCQYCSAPSEKSWTACVACRAKRDHERFKALPCRPWDGESPVCLWGDDRYFWSIDEFEDWIEDEDIDRSKVMLVHCKPVYAQKIGDDYACDQLPDDGELPSALKAAVETFNAAVEAYGVPLSWESANIRVELP